MAIPKQSFMPRWFLFLTVVFHTFIFKSYPTHLPSYSTLAFSSQVLSFFLLWERERGFLLYQFQINFYVNTIPLFKKTDYMLTSNYYKMHCTYTINDTTSVKKKP
jgi:hypothetical protein